MGRKVVLVSAARQIVQAAVSLSFLALGVFTIADWLRHRDQSRGYLALALATLGLTSVVSQLNVFDVGTEAEPESESRLA